METSPGAPPAPPPLEAPQNGRRTAPAGGSSDCRRWRGVCLGREGVPRGSGLVTVDESGAARSRVDKVCPCPVGSDRKSTRLNSSHVANSYAVFCLKKKASLNIKSDK